MTSAIEITKRNMTARLIQEAALRKPKRNKYKAIKTTVDGRKFDSKAEARRGAELELLQRAGQIQNLQYQVRYQFMHNGTLIGTYVADFVYHDSTGLVVEDVKGVQTPVFKIKERLMRAFYGVVIRVVK